MAFLLRLKEGHRPEIPSTAPPEAHSLITKCWAVAPSERPSFAMILSALTDREEAAEKQSCKPSSVSEDGYI